MALLQSIRPGWLESSVGILTILISISILSICVVLFSLIYHSIQLANSNIPFVTSKKPFAIVSQHYSFLVDGPGLIKRGYGWFVNGLFEVPRTFRFGQVVVCKPELIEELKNVRSTVASPEPWIDQLLQISHVMPGYFPSGGWPSIAKTTPGIIRGTVHKHLDRYVPAMNEAIHNQLRTLSLNESDGCTISCFEFAYSVVARSGSYTMVGERLANNEEYLKAVKEHILGMIMTTRVQFLVPECLKKYIGGFIARLATIGTRWDMHASRKILLRHFNSRVIEYRNDMACHDNVDESLGFKQTDKAVEIFRWLYEGSVLRHRWSYSEVLGEMLLLQFAFIYTTGYALYSALYELARQPGYIHSLREEVKSMLAEYGPTVSGCNRMVLLDSFLKECQRLHPPAAISAHRVCVKKLEFSNGITLKPGTHVGVPSSWIQRSTAYYEDPDTFDGYRFVKRAAAGEPNTKLVDLSPSYLVFGMGVHACPGRWMASVLMKLVISELLIRFDILPCAESSSQGPIIGSLSFEEFYVPNFALKVRLRPRM